MATLYRYVHVSDDGMAPASTGGLVSLATCKPVIRRCAGPGDWVLGFYPSPAPQDLLGWAGRVARILDHGDYEVSFRGRPDAVYRRNADGMMTRLRDDYHPNPDDAAKDLSAPVLLFDPQATWYFGEDPQMLPAPLMHLAARGQGHRVNPRVAGDEEQLLRWLRGTARPGVHGRPRHSSDIASCAPCGGARRHLHADGHGSPHGAGSTELTWLSAITQRPPTLRNRRVLMPSWGLPPPSRR